MFGKAHPESLLLPVPERRCRGLRQRLQIRPHPKPLPQGRGFIAADTQRFGKAHPKSPLLPVPERRRRSLCRGCKSDPFEAHPRGKAFEFRSPRIEVSKQAQTVALYHVDATKARMRSATAQIRTTLPPERWSIRDSSRHEPEHPSPTTATFMHARWRFFAFNS